MTIQTEIERICNETLSGIICWNLVEGLGCTYETWSGDIHVVLQCCKPIYYLKINDKEISIYQDMLDTLCESIKTRTKIDKELEIVKALETIQGNVKHNLVAGRIG